MSSSRKPLSLFLTRLTPAIWAQFNGFYETRKLDYRPMAVPEAGIWIVCNEMVKVPMGFDNQGRPVEVEAPMLVAGCCLYPGHGPFIVVEYVSTRPGIPLRTGHTAVERITMAVSTYGAMVGKIPLCFPIDKGVERLMYKAGYSRTVEKLTKVMYSPQFVTVHHDPGPREPASERITIPAPATLVAND